MPDFLIKGLQAVIKLYALLVSPLLGQNCRFYPTCSCYAHQALEYHGFVRGVFLSIRRILKCHPWYKGSFHDPVPGYFE